MEERVRENGSEFQVASLWVTAEGSSRSMCFPEIHVFRRQAFSEVEKSSVIPETVPQRALEDTPVQRLINQVHTYPHTPSVTQCESHSHWQ